MHRPQLDRVVGLGDLLPSLESETRGWSGIWFLAVATAEDAGRIGGREGILNGTGAVGVCDRVSLCCFPTDFSLCMCAHFCLHIHFPLVFFPLSCDSARLSRMLGMYFLAVAESELSHFTDRTKVGVDILLKGIKQACEHYKNIIFVRRARSI